MRRFAPFVVAAVVALTVVAFIVGRPTQPNFVPAAGGVAIGPAARHPRSATDIGAQIATGALDTAAGSSGNQLIALGDAPPTAEEQAMLDLTNADRASNGLPPLMFDTATLWVARARAAAQVPDGPLSHYNSLGDLAFVGLLGDAAVSYSLAGENLARAAGIDPGVPDRLNQALMNSPLHRANILEPSFDMLAIGAASISQNSVAYAEIFRSSGAQGAVAAAASDR